MNREIKPGLRIARAGDYYRRYYSEPGEKSAFLRQVSRNGFTSWGGDRVTPADGQDVLKPVLSFRTYRIKQPRLRCSVPPGSGLPQLPCSCIPGRPAQHPLGLS